MHKWILRFNGESYPLTIPELEEKIATYGFDPEEVPRAMSEILEGRAARWFRTSRLQTASNGIPEFLRGPRHIERLEHEIRSHVQGVGETFKNYLIELRTMMQQAGYSVEE